MSFSPADRRIPENYEPRYRELDQRAGVKWLSRNYAPAERLYKELLAFVQATETELRHPLHKGGPLHMIGMSLIPLGRMEEAVYHILLAYVEDVLSAAVDEEDESDRLPAASVLRDFFLIRLRVLGEIKRFVVEIKRADRLKTIFDPMVVLGEVARKLGFETSNLLSQCRQVPRVPEKQPLGFPQPSEQRVFIGGNYKEQRPNLNKIREAVILRRYTPVIADEVYIPKKWIHHHTLMLLHTCSYAIFDVTSQAGQLMEIERAPDYGIKMLIIWAAPDERHARRPPEWISSMIRTLKYEKKFQMRGYTDFDQIPDIVNDFLPELR